MRRNRSLLPPNGSELSTLALLLAQTCTVLSGLSVSPATPAVPPSVCNQQEFQCSDSTQCVPLEQVCDFRKDCSNGADEDRCGACDFTDDLCGLTNLDLNAGFGWNLTRAQDVKQNKIFPDRDSEGKENGAYAAYSLWKQDAPVSKYNSMVTPRLGAIAHSCIVSFYVYVLDTGSLVVGVLTQSVDGTAPAYSVPLASVNGSALKGRWHKLSVPVGNWDAGERFFYRTDTLGTSVDAINYSDCHPDTRAEGSEASLKVSCDFSNPSVCGWFPERQDSDLNWVLFSGAAEQTRLRWQPADSMSHSGAYMYTHNPFAIHTTAHLVSIKMSPTPKGGRCITFWYNMWHPNSGVLNVLERVSEVSVNLLWTRSGPQGKAWQQGQVQVHSDVPHQLVFEAIMMPSVPAVIAVDQITLKEGPCDTGKACTFESGSCGWQLHNWELSKSRLGKGGIVALPEVDHTAQAPTGTFALLKASGGRMLSAPGWYDVSKHKCLRFWYFIAGNDDEALNVTRLARRGGQPTIWCGTKADAPMARWYSAAAALTGSPGSTMMVFQGSTSGDPGTAVAVDDITLAEVACPPPGSCSFEEDMCNWFNTRGSGYPQWYRSRGGTASENFRLSTDHTMGTADGYYILLDAEDLNSAKGGSLQSQRLSFGPVVCFKLYYYRKKETSASFNVSFVDSLGKPVGKEFSTDNNAHIDWTLLSVEQSELPEQFSIVIAAKTAVPGGNIAIDDIDVRPGKCRDGSDVTSVAPRPETSAATALQVSTETDEPSSQGTTATPLLETTAAAALQVSHKTDESSPEGTTAAPLPEQPSTVGPETKITAVATTITPPRSVPPPNPPTECSRGYFDCQDGATCIPSILLCDGIRDCPNGLDEYCACPHNLCLNGGLCTWTSREPSPICNCTGDYEGSRCQLITSSTETSKEELKHVGAIRPVVTGILVTLAFLITGAVITAVVRRRRRFSVQNSPMYHDNPIYDSSTKLTRFS
ncbi:apical endosomal glycoprotein-like isoform X2 [Haemaphysalis longicornis]